MSNSSTSSLKLNFYRALTVLLVFSCLGIYLWLIQVAYEEATASWIKALLFTLIIFGGGLSWDVIKEVARLPNTRMAVFAAGMWSCLIWAIIYIVGFGLGVLVIGPLAGYPTIGLVFYWIIAVLALYMVIVNFDRAVNAAVKADKADSAA